MSGKYKHVSPAIFIIGSLISIWFLVGNLQQLRPALYSFAFILIIGLYMSLKVYNNDFLRKAKKRATVIASRKYFVVTALSAITVIGLLARLFFYYRFSYTPVSDPMTFYDAAVKLASGGGSLGNNYVAFHTYLASYNNILGVTVRFISSPWLATILLNTVFDILSSVAICILLKKMLKPNSKLPVVAFGVWMLNPMSIIYSVISLPVVIVNFFVILTILISYILIQQITKLNTKKAVLMSLIFGLALGLGNCFRPIFIVAIIALTIVFIFMFLTTNKSVRFLKLFMGCLLLSLLMLTVIQKLNVMVVSNQTGLNAAKNPTGWSMYVGSTWDTNGEWRPYHNDERQIICADSLARNNFDECHNKLRSEAIERYKKYGLLISSSLFIQKLYHQAEEQNYFYNAEHSIVGYTTSRTFKLINIYSVLYITTLFILSAKFLYSLAERSALNKVVDPIMIFLALIMIGLFFSSMFVESAPRYSTIMYPMFIIFSVLALDKKYTFKRLTK